MSGSIDQLLDRKLADLSLEELGQAQGWLIRNLSNVNQELIKRYETLGSVSEDFKKTKAREAGRFLVRSAQQLRKFNDVLASEVARLIRK